MMTESMSHSSLFWLRKNLHFNKIPTGQLWTPKPECCNCKLRWVWGFILVFLFVCFCFFPLLQKVYLLPNCMARNNNSESKENQHVGALLTLTWPYLSAGTSSLRSFVLVIFLLGKAVRSVRGHCDQHLLWGKIPTHMEPREQSLSIIWRGGG